MSAATIAALASAIVAVAGAVTALIGVIRHVNGPNHTSSTP